MVGRGGGSLDHAAHAGGEGLYDARFEHDACGVGFVVDVSGGGLARSSPRPSVLASSSTEERAAASPTPGMAPDCWSRRHTASSRESARRSASPFRGRRLCDRERLPATERRRPEQCQRRSRRPLRPAVTASWAGGRFHDARASADGACIAAVIRQVVLRRPADVAAPLEYERRLYVLRRCSREPCAARRSRARALLHSELSSRTIVYKEC